MTGYYASYAGVGQVVLEFRLGCSDVKRNRDAAGTPDAVQRGHIVEAGRDENGDAFFFQIHLGVEQAGGEPVNARICLAIGILRVALDQRGSFVALGKSGKSDARHFLCSWRQGGG